MSQLENTSPPPSPTDALMGRVILAVSGVVILCVLGGIVLAVLERDTPDWLPITMASALSGLLALLAGKRAA